MQESSGAPEVSSGFPSPPESPPLAASAGAYDYVSTPWSPKSPTTSSRFHGSGTRVAGAAYTITEECERLFCEDLRTIFLGEEGSSTNSLVVGALDDDRYIAEDMRHELRMATSDDVPVSGGLHDLGYATLQEYIEVWDYVGSARFRGFTAGSTRSKEKTLFVFFDQDVVGKDLKQGYVIILTGAIWLCPLTRRQADGSHRAGIRF